MTTDNTAPEEASVAEVPRWCPFDGTLLVPGTLPGTTLEGWICPECGYFEQ